MDVIQRIAEELSVNSKQVSAAVALLDEGATVPFISRYRKEVTGGLDDTQLRQLEERLGYLRELNERRKSILDSIKSQDKLTSELEKAIVEADTKTLLEDLYLPYKPKRRTKAQIAREAGLEPLADALLNDRSLIPEIIAAGYIDAEKGVPDIASGLDGARQIIMERISEDAELLAGLRERVWQKGIIHATVVTGKEQAAEKFKDYFDYQEAISKIPSHRALALFRGRNEDLLSLTLKPGAEDKEEHDLCARFVARHFNIKDTSKPADAWLTETARFAWKIKLFTRIDLDLKLRLREAAELEAIRVFASNLRDLLLAAPAGPKATMGLDPGIRTGVKVAIVDPTGKLLTTDTIYPHPPCKQWDQSISTLAKLIQKHKVDLVSIGNGTGSRETDQLVADIMSRHNELKFTKITVSEAGASVYSASELAAKEFPDLDVSLRGAVSIARRLQDPLAELVKIDPKSIGVGQYQHDVNQVQLARGLNVVVEDCVNAVGVDVNTASVSLLKQVSGLSTSVSENIVTFRNENGPFVNRKQLKKVPRLGDKAYEQAAGFLRIMNGDNPLDASAVHPEAYPVVEAIIASTGKSIRDLIGQSGFLRNLNPTNFTNEHFGLPTVTDILQELEKPGRDPRPEFKSVEFKAGIEKISDLEPGMRLDGVVTNVANFGAFVDIGVHQDGLVHISHLSDTFIKDPRDAVKTGDMVKVKVLEVDIERKRISLTMKTNTDTMEIRPERNSQKQANKAKQQAPAQGLMANAFAKALKKVNINSSAILILTNTPAGFDMTKLNYFYISFIFSALFMVYLPTAQADMKQQNYTYTPTPATSDDDRLQQSSYSEKVGNKALNAFANLTTSTLEMPKNIINTMNQSNFFYGVFGGFLKGLVNTLGRTGCGIADLITFPLPTKPIAYPVYIWDDFDVDTTYGEVFRLNKTPKTDQTVTETPAPAPAPTAVATPPKAVAVNHPNQYSQDTNRKLDQLFSKEMQK